MIIKFNKIFVSYVLGSSSMYEERASVHDSNYWIYVLWSLNDEFDKNSHTLKDHNFIDWIYSNWKIKILNDVGHPNLIDGIEVDDACLTLILLKFPSKELDE